MTPVPAPEHLDMTYRFFNLYSVKELMYRLIGLPFGIIFGLLSKIYFGSLYAIIFGLIFVAVGWFVGSRKVLHNIPLLLAILWKHQLDQQSKILYNTRVHSDVDYTKADNRKLGMFADMIK